MPAKLERLEAGLRDRVSKSSGGWPHWLHIDRASTSLVGTAHSLAMLRMLGYEAQDDLVAGGMRYLALEVKEQLKPGGRGVYARYPAYALWGLMRFPAAVSEPEVLEGAKFSASWLMRRQRPAGAWTLDGERNDELPVSLPATMAAVHGLDRLAPYVRGAFGQRSMATTSAARDAIMATAERADAGVFWRQLPGGVPCPGATSLAVLTLAGGSREHREMAQQGIEYLRADRLSWTRSVHIDDQLEQLTWRIMSFSLGLRALLHPCAPSVTAASSKQIIQEVVSHFDDLWDEENGAWSVQQGHRASTTGSYAVLAALRALKNRSEFDPVKAYGLTVNSNGQKDRSGEAIPGRQRAGTGNSQRQVRLIPDQQRISIKDPELSDREFFVDWDSRARSQWGILEHMLRLKLKANESQRQDQYEYTVSPAELATYAKHEAVDPATVDRTIRRINQKIAAAAAEVRIHSFPLLIEKIVPGDSTDFRYGIEEAQVVIGRPPSPSMSGQVSQVSVDS
jgi:hypothetical protein